jgi:hypothetical protein
MKRRDFVVGAITAFTFIMNSGTEAREIALGSILKMKLPKKKIHLESNQFYLAKESTLFHLPKEPKHGDFLQIAVDQKSLERPCVLVSDMARIVGEKEPLVLDSLAIFKLRYDSLTNNWKIG